MNLSFILSILATEEAKEALSFLGGYIATNTLDSLLAKHNKDLSPQERIYIQLYKALSGSLEATCEKYEWVYDPSAINETFTVDGNLWESINSENKLAKVLGDALGLRPERVINTSEAEAWIDFFYQQISCHTELFNYLHLKETDYIKQRIIEKPCISSISFDAMIEEAREQVKKEAIFPWFYDSIKYKEAFPNLFVTPRFSNKIPFERIEEYHNSNIAVLGEAGSGKSTLLRYFFAYIMHPSCKVLYTSANDLRGSEYILDEINRTPIEDGKKKHLILIDGIDEAFFNDYAAYESFVRHLKRLNNCRFWLGCRRDFFITFYGENTAITEANFELESWNPAQYNHFINTYEKIWNDANPEKPIDLQSAVSAILGEDEENIKLKKNPFQLALIVFLATTGDEETIQGVYDLYEKFLRYWFKRETERGTSKASKQDILCELRNAATAIYNSDDKNKKWTLTQLAIENTAIFYLLKTKEVGDIGEIVATEFYHRSIIAFLLASNIIEAFESCDFIKTKELLSTKLKDDVTNFVGDKFRLLSNGEKEIIKDNLEVMYRQYPLSQDSLSYHEQIIYFITRLGVDVSEFLLSIIRTKPKNRIMRLTLAYGSVLSENPEVRQYALEYAESIASGSIDAATNRGWTVVYFGDVNGKDPYTYLDDEKQSWKKARAARIKRFTKKEPRLKDVRFWLFDIPLFHSFLVDRDWNDISRDEMKLIQNLNIDEKYFNKTEKEFLEKEKRKLLDDYSLHLK